MPEAFHVVIPARYHATRLPGKPLADLHGLPMIVRVAQRAAAAGAREVLVATDDERILAAVTQAGYRAVMTRADHLSGSDRVMEVAAARGWPEDTTVVNVQGDEPLIPVPAIAQVAACLTGHTDRSAATLCEPIDDVQTLFDPNVVKVVRAADGSALYFSRAPVPHDRELFTPRPQALPAAGPWYRHVGIYAFRVSTLRRFVQLPPGTLEQREMLEQLRLLENGIPIYVAEACEPVPAGVDTPADLERVRAQLSS